MAKFSLKSKRELETADERLQRLFNEAIKHVDFSITDCARSQAQQDDYVARGLSKTKHGKHVVTPEKPKARACDATLYPPRWFDASFRDDLLYFAGFVRGLALAMGIPLRAGADWNRNGIVSDETFEDLVHFEIDE